MQQHWLLLPPNPAELDPQRVWKKCITSNTPFLLHSFHKVFYARSWYLLGMDDDLKIVLLDSTWNTLLELEATTVDTSTTGIASSSSNTSSTSAMSSTSSSDESA